MLSVHTCVDTCKLIRCASGIAGASLDIVTYSSIARLDDPKGLGAVAARHYNRLARAEGVHFHVVEVHSAAPRVGNRLPDQFCELVVAANPRIQARQTLAKQA